MGGATRISAVIAAVLVSTAALQPAICHAEPAAPAPGPALATTDPALQASLTRISRGSALWREALEAVRRTGRRLLVVTPADLVVADPGKGRKRIAFDPSVLAEVFPLLDANSRLSVVVTVVNLSLIRDIHDARFSAPRDFEADLDRILVHETYGHAVPYLLAGDLSGRCADPRQGEDPAGACSIRRENAVRAELGLGRRSDDGLYSLMLAMGR